MTKLPKERIDEIFEQAENQADYVYGLYKEVFPRWDEIEHINGHPTVSYDTNMYIFGKAMQWDKENAPSVLAGGAWMNSGFSARPAGDSSIPDWHVSVEKCDVEYIDKKKGK